MNELQKNELNKIEVEIEFYKGQAVQSILEIGERLIKAKELVEHGEWENWLDEKVEFSSMQANRFMRVAREFSNQTSVLDLGQTKVFAMLAVPKEEREEFMKENPVEDMTTRELRQAIKDRKEEQAKREEVEKQKHQLEKELEAAKNKKPEVIEKRVVPEDYEELKGSQKAMQDKIQQLEAANAGLNNEYNKLANEIENVDEKSKKYDELNKAMESMNTKLNDGQRRLRAQKEVYDLIKAGEKAVEELAPLSYLIDGTSITGNDYARDPIIKLANNLEKISSRLWDTVGNSTIIEG